jgi:hypothetical protein
LGSRSRPREPLPAFGREHRVFDNPRETLKGGEL